jgi:hypothetical protein
LTFDRWVNFFLYTSATCFDSGWLVIMVFERFVTFDMELFSFCTLLWLPTVFNCLKKFGFRLLISQVLRFGNFGSGIVNLELKFSDLFVQNCRLFTYTLLLVAFLKIIRYQIWLNWSVLTKSHYFSLVRP